MSHDTEVASAPVAPQNPDRLVFGLTLDQVDALGRLTGILIANGDVISISGAGPLDSRTMPTLGEAIYEAAYAVRGILDQIEAQRLALPTDPIAPVATPVVPPSCSG